MLFHTFYGLCFNRYFDDWEYTHLGGGSGKEDDGSMIINGEGSLRMKKDGNVKKI